MKTQLNPFVKFIKRLPGTWVQQAAALMGRIKNLPQKPVAVKNIAIIIIFLATTSLALGTIMWIYLDGICKNCGDGRESDHLESCGNCDILVYKCPTLLMTSHQAICEGCGEVYNTCDNPNTLFEEKPAYRHRIVGAGGPNEHYACSRPRENF